MSVVVQELAKQDIEAVTQNSDVLQQIVERSPNGFEDVRARVGERVGTYGVGLEVALSVPLGMADIREADTMIVHPLGLGNGIMGPNGKGGHQLVLAEIMATACNTPVITIGSPTPKSRYGFSLAEMWSYSNGDARPYTQRIVEAITDPALGLQLSRVDIASSTQPGGAIGPRLANDIRDHSNGDIQVGKVLVGDPITVMHRGLREVIASSTNTATEAYATPLGDSLMRDLYVQSLISESARTPSNPEKWEAIAHTIHKMNTGERPLNRTLAMTVATAAFMRHPSLFRDTVAIHRTSPETQFVIGFTNSPVTPESELTSGFERAIASTPSLANQLAIVALRGVGRETWDNPTIWPLLQTAS